MEKDGEKIEELEQTLFELRGEIGAGRHVPPGIRVLSLSANPAQEWADLRQAALDRLKEENAALLQRLSTLSSSSSSNSGPNPNPDSTTSPPPKTEEECVKKKKGC